MQPRDKTIISPTPPLVNFNEYYHYSELLFALASRDFKIRYAQAAVGLAWAILQPIAAITILYLVFVKFISVDMGGIPPLLFISVGFTAWTFFSYVITNSGSSVIQAQAMIKKVYFPRIFVPLAKAMTGVVDLLIGLLIIGALMIWYGAGLPWTIMFFPFFLGLLLASAIGIGLLISAISIKYRDFQYVTPFMVQLGLYITPVAYPGEFALTRLPDWAIFLYYANPIAGIIEGMRWSLFNLGDLTSVQIFSMFLSIPLLVGGFLFFEHKQKDIADLV